MNISSFGIIRNGKAEIPNRELFAEKLKKFEGKHVEISISTINVKRSNRFNRYYWGVVVESILFAFLDLGHDVDRWDIHEFLKNKFSYSVIILKDEPQKLPTSTSKKDNAEFMAYVEKCRLFAHEALNIEIPEPKKLEENDI